MWFYSAAACIVESIIKEASGGLVLQGSATATLGSECIACEIVSDDKYAEIRSMIHHGKPRHLTPIHPLCILSV